ERVFAVECDLEMGAFEIHAQGVPGVQGHRDFGTLELGAFALERVIDGDVVLQRVGAGDVVIVAVLPTPDQAARLVFLSGNGLEPDLNEAVGERNIRLYAPGIGAFAGLLENIRLAGGGGVRLDGPMGVSLAGDASHPAVRYRSGPGVVEIHGFGMGANRKCGAGGKGEENAVHRVLRLFVRFDGTFALSPDLHKPGNGPQEGLTKLAGGGNWPRGMTTANKVTILRILLIPLFIVQILYYLKNGNELHRFLGLMSFAIAAILDGVDGYIARRYNQKSELGAILDPL